VRVTFAINDVVTNFMVGDNEWRETNLQVPWPYVGSFVDYHISADRTWSGAEFGLNSDTRQIGITIEDWSWLTTDGMQPEERWPQDGSPMAGVPFRWTAEHARMLVQCDEPYLRVPMLVTHPDVTSDPVYVSVTINSNRVADVEWQEPRWHDLVVFCGSKELRALPKDYVCLAFDVSRTWSPVFHGIADMRDLGVAVAEPEPVPSDGLYQRELWNNTFPYQWAARRARWAAQADIHGALDVTYLIDHPDLAQRPVTWRLTIDGRLADEEVVTTSGWRTVTFDREPFTIHDLEAEVDRDWSPQDQGIDDARRLGFAIRRQSGNE